MDIYNTNEENEAQHVSEIHEKICFMGNFKERTSHKLVNLRKVLSYWCEVKVFEIQS